MTLTNTLGYEIVSVYYSCKQLIYTYIINWRVISGCARHRPPPRVTSRLRSLHNRSAATSSLIETASKAELTRKARNSAKLQPSPLSCFYYNSTLYLERFPHFRRHDLPIKIHVIYIYTVLSSHQTFIVIKNSVPKGIGIHFFRNKTLTITTYADIIECDDL
jgi:hypothetical protein